MGRQFVCIARAVIDIRFNILIIIQVNLSHLSYLPVVRASNSEEPNAVFDADESRISRRASKYLVIPIAPIPVVPEPLNGSNLKEFDFMEAFTGYSNLTHVWDQFGLKTQVVQNVLRS